MKSVKNKIEWVKNNLNDQVADYNILYKVRDNIWLSVREPVGQIKDPVLDMVLKDNY